MRRLAVPVLVALALAGSGARAEEPASPPAGEGAAVTPPAKDRPANRLAKESSPYLLQHARNPVDWYPWGDEAFAKAKREDRPVFLSIGYSTCHWCHVMERESFESEAIAELLNADFVSIKVDREERPDVDSVYMTAIQATGQGGGWPLTAFLDHERRPFFLGTYFPPDDRWGRPGFATVLKKVLEAWKGKREDVARAGEELESMVKGSFATPPPAEVGMATVATGVRQFQARFDAARGGFGDAPKFPRAHALSFLLQSGDRPGLENGREMALATLRAMGRGGMYDHVGGGFHRYSTDGDWLVPHFEKMLYDQALLARALVEAWQVSGDPEFERLARETLDYCLRDLRHADGGLLCAEDADSEGVEGKFYLWTTAELRAALGEEDGALASRVFGAKDGGNFHGEAEAAPPGGNILHHPAARDALAKEAGLDRAALDARIDAWRARLLAIRAQRVRPHLDDKVLAAWNGLGISALARAGRAFGEPRFLEAAARAADFVLGRLKGEDGGLRRSWREGRTGAPGHLDDHAFLGLGLLDLHEAAGDPARLAQALDLARRIPVLFADPAGGAFFDAPAVAKDLLARTRETEDWAMPSGNSVAAILLLRAGRLAGDPALEERGRAALRALSGTLDRLPIGSPALLCALDFDLGPSREVVLAGEPADPAFRALEREVSRRFLPRAVTAWRPAGGAASKAAPWLAPYGPVDGKPAAFVCTKGVCKRPVTTAEELGRLLEEKGE